MKKEYISPVVDRVELLFECNLAAGTVKENGAGSGDSDAKQKGNVDEEDEDEFEAALWQVNH